MGRSLPVCPRIAVVVMLCLPLGALGASLLTPGDFIIAIDTDTTVAASGYAAAESPNVAIDANTTSQYRNTGGVGSGFIVTPWVGPTVVTSFVITTAADDDTQDPAAWALYGTNDTVVSADNSTGGLENWTLIASDAINLPLSRVTPSDVVNIANTTAYTSYRMVFTALRGAATSMHFAEVQFDGEIVNPIPIGLLKPGDFIIAIDEDPFQSNSAYTRAEFPTNVRDGLVTTKFLDFSEENAGFITTPASGPSIVRSLIVTTANDGVERDPAAYAIYGTNDPIQSVDNSLGLAENWTLIATGPLALPDTRYTAGPVVTFENSTSYTSYKVLFPKVKNPLTANSMQVAEVGLYESADGTGTSVLVGNGLILAVNSNSGSAYNRAEFPTNIRDGSAQTKYLNFGMGGCGFIVTPVGGPSAVQSLIFTTANDHEERDPASFELYGTNDPITSTDNSRGNAENWTFIMSGSPNLPAARFTAGPVIAFGNTVEYTSYKLVFPTVKNNVATANSMQIAEIGFFESLDGTGPNLLASPAPILAVDPDSASIYPAAENPPNVRDGNTATKYLNNGKANTGFIATPDVGPTTVRSMVLTTANDAADRDPASYAVYGTNDSILSGDNSFGDAESWTLIAEGELALPATRLTAGPVVTFTNEVSYTSYKVIFPTIKNFAAANSMQIAEVALLESTDGTGTNVLSGVNPVLAVDTDSASAYPVGERSQNVRDGNVATKYSNAGRMNSGFIATPSSGPSIVQSLKLSTANDLPDRDPTTFILYGTNEPILSTDNSFGNAENWTLIAEGALALPAARLTAAPVVTFTNSTSYASYKLIFPTIKDVSATNMQISEAGLYESTDATGDNVLAGTGPILAVDADSGSRYPVGQRPANVRDGTSNTKYRNTAEENAGLIATPSVGTTVIRSIVLTTADDQEAADPASFALYGTNDPIVSTDNSVGTGESWTLIAGGALALPAGRRTVAPLIPIVNETGYLSYKLIFPTVKDAATADSMQISEIGLFESADGTGTNVLVGNGPILAIDADPIIDSNYPAGEPPANVIDGTTAKYLNFGAARSGFIVTPSVGPTVANALRIITANDATERDPMSWQLYGTNDPITSADNGNGTSENWSLIASGSTGAPLARLVSGPVVGFNNEVAYESYKLVFSTVRNEELANSMQVAEIQFYGLPGLPCPTPFADFDEDGDVDQMDFGALQQCFTGQTAEGYAAECACLDKDANGTIDSEDMAAFMDCVSGPSILWSQGATPDCLP